MSQVRRWQLHVSMQGFRGFSGPVVSTKGFVRVREDVVTEEDRQAVAHFLADVGSDEFCQHYIDQAGELLSLVLGSGKEDKDA